METWRERRIVLGSSEVGYNGAPRTSATRVNGRGGSVTARMRENKVGCNVVCQKSH